MLEIEAVDEGRRARLKEFVRIPWGIYQQYPQWVPPLIADRLKELDRRKNYFFQHSDARYFVARRNGRAVGRIAAIRNNEHLRIFQDGTGFFGFFECEQNPETARALLERAGDWLRAEGLTNMRGPINFSMNGECGLLLEGYEYAPMILMNYNPPYYHELMDAAGMQGCMDLLAYRVEPGPDGAPARLRRAHASCEKRGITIRSMDFSRFEEEIDTIFAVHRVAFAENWGEVPPSLEEARHAARDLKLIADPRMILIAEDAGRPIGIAVCFPDFNQAIRRANGRLFPFGLFRILRDKRRINSIRVALMGVLKEYRRRGVDAALVYKIFEHSKERGYAWGEMSWILESNAPMNAIMGRLGGEQYKRYRLYETAL